MKFFYTRGGKALAFIACILCAAIFAAAGIGAIYMIDKGYYDRSEREVYDSAIYGQLRNNSMEVIWDADRSGYCPVLLADRGNLSFMVVDTHGRYIAISRGAKEAGWGYDPDQYRYKMYCRIMKNAPSASTSTAPLPWRTASPAPRDGCISPTPCAGGSLGSRRSLCCSPLCSSSSS